MSAPLLKIHPGDNVAVALAPVPKGTVWEDITSAQDIPQGHKLCLRDIPQGGMAVKYGAPIGHAVTAIQAGEWVHTHNLKTNLEGTLKYVYQPNFRPLPPREPGTFLGYRRPDGGTGIRNELWIIPAVGCVNGIAETLARRAQWLARGGVEGVYAFPHPYGCSQMGEDHENTKKALCGLIRHSNAGGVLVLGLGCENNAVDGMKKLLGDYDPRRVKFLVCQDSADEIGDALALLEELAAYAAPCVREEIPMSELVIGLKCGGSDGLSGITANPLVGAFSDLLVAEGGTTILTEVPEMFGAETLLMNRCADRETFEKTVRLVNGFKEYFLLHGQVVYENPSPGNKAGGITTLEDKSLGCTQKGGSAPVTDVLQYGASVTRRGLNLLEAPGNDLVASTAEAAAGAHLVLFTTGRGTPFGAPVPTVKISSNTALYDHKRNWIDFDAGALARGADIHGEAGRLYEYVRRLASGELRTKTEEQGIRDLAIFKSGVTL